MRPVAPKGDEVEVGPLSINSIPISTRMALAARKRAGKSDCEQERGNDEVSSERSHHLAPSFSCRATMTAPMVAAVSSRATISSGST